MRHFDKKNKNKKKGNKQKNILMRRFHDTFC